MAKEQKKGDLRVWHVPQVPCKAFRVEVPNLETAALMVRTLGDYDLFQHENRIKPDYANMTGVEVYWPDVADDTGDPWVDWHSTEGDGLVDLMRAGADLGGVKWEGDDDTD